MLSTLHLVYPPVSNAHAEILKDDADTEARIRRSDLYMMATRPEVVFDPSSVRRQGASITIPVLSSSTTGVAIHDEVTLDLSALAVEALGKQPDGYTCYGTEDFFGFWAGLDVDTDSDESGEPFAWFTTEKLLHDMSRGAVGLTGLDRRSDFMRYELLYVGIAKTSDTFDRLFAAAHAARQSILTAEWPRSTDSRVSDELILFPFRVEPVIYRTMGLDDDLTEMSSDEWAAYGKRVVADAEKAFVHLLDPQYNNQKYRNYPRGLDGVYGQGHERYAYVIAENITLVTGTESIRGSWDPSAAGHTNAADWIAVEGDYVEIHRGADGV